jgi:hypothetical protein
MSRTFVADNPTDAAELEAFASDPDVTLNVTSLDLNRLPVHVEAVPHTNTLAPLLSPEHPSLFKQRAKSGSSFVGHPVEAINRFRRCLDVELPVAARCIDTSLAPRLPWDSRGLTAGEIVFLGDPADRFFRERLIFLRFEREGR